MGILRFIAFATGFLKNQPRCRNDELEGVAELIRNFVKSGDGLSEWDWDDFITRRHKDPEIEKIRIELLDIERKFPPDEIRGGWCSDEGLKKMLELADLIESEKFS